MVLKNVRLKFQRQHKKKIPISEPIWFFIFMWFLFFTLHLLPGCLRETVNQYISRYHMVSLDYVSIAQKVFLRWMLVLKRKILQVDLLETQLSRVNASIMEKKKKWINNMSRASLIKNPPASAGDGSSIPGPGRFHMPWSNEAPALQLEKSSHCKEDSAQPKINKEVINKSQ